MPCAIPKYWNFGTLQCLSCPTGEVYDLVSKRCTPCPSAVPLYQNGKCVPCPTNNYYDSLLKQCVPCPGAMIYNPSLGKCV